MRDPSQETKMPRHLRGLGLLFITSILGSTIASPPLFILAAAQDLSLSRSNITFGKQALGSTSTTAAVTLTSHTNLAVSILSVTMSGDFAQTSNCGETLPPKGKCTISVSFTPVALELRAGTLTIAHSGNNSPLVVTLKGTGVPPVEMSKSSLSFPATVVGTTSAARTVTLTNNQDVALSILAITATGDFGETNNCGAILPARSKCTIGTTFTPTAVGERTGMLTVAHSAPSSPQTATLSGSGNANGLKRLTVTPADPSIPLGSSQQFAATATFKNNSTADFTMFVTWSSLNLAVASIGNGAGSQGLATSTGQGSTTIGATLGGISGSTTLTVVPPALASIAVTPLDLTIQAGQTQQFSATGTYTDTSSQDLTASVAWTSSDGGVATVDPSGLATGVAGGSATISATVGAISGATELTVSGATDFAATGGMSSARYGHTATLLNTGKVLVAGGSGGELTAELYDPASGTFTDTGSMTVFRGSQSHTATLLNDGKVLIAGGSGPDGNRLDTAELYDPATGTFTATGAMNFPRNGGHTATLLTNGKVLIAGGENEDAVLTTAELYDPATGTFAAAGTMTGGLGRTGHTATLLNDGKVLIAGGIWDASYRTELYDPESGTFIASGSMTSPRFLHTATLLNNGKLLLAGGDGYNWASAELYDPSTGTLTPTGDMTGPRMLHRATLLSNGTVLISGGQTSGDWVGALASAELYDPATGTFTATTGSMASPRKVHSTTLLNNGVVLFAGGHDGSIPVPEGIVASAELYTPSTLTPAGLVSIAVTPVDPTISPGATRQFIATGTFSDDSTQTLASAIWSSSDPAIAEITNDASNRGLALAVSAGSTTIAATAGSVGGSTTLTVRPAGFFATGTMTSPRNLHRAILLNDGRVLIAGGSTRADTIEPASVLASAELYDPTTETFTTTGSMTVARYYPSATLMNSGKVLITGGFSGSASDISSAELYDPATATFTATGSMTIPRYTATATLLTNGKVLIAGGWSGHPGGRVASAELYDPATGTFTPTGSMTIDRDSHTATLLNDGRVLIAGGNSSGPIFSLASAELYDPAAGTFTATGSMTVVGGELIQATLLDDGTVLVAGGWSGSALASAELYDPASGTFTPAGSMAAGRYGHTSTRLDDGTVLVAGGGSGSVALGSAELYDPATRTFTTNGDMTSVRLYHTATRLSDGAVLITGGSQQFDVLATAELYTPRP